MHNYKIHQEVIYRHGRCRVHGRTYEEHPRYMLVDQRGRTHRDVPHDRIKPITAEILGWHKPFYLEHGESLAEEDCV